jgi:hypothetical protein
MPRVPFALHWEKVRIEREKPNAGGVRDACASHQFPASRLFDFIRDLGLAVLVMVSTQPEIVAGLGGDALEAQALVVRVLFAQKGMQRQEAGAFGLAQHTLAQVRGVSALDFGQQFGGGRCPSPTPQVEFFPSLARDLRNDFEQRLAVHLLSLAWGHVATPSDLGAGSPRRYRRA